VTAASPAPATTTPTTTTATTTTAPTTTAAGGGSAALALGKQIFLVKADCGSCHALKDAGSTGTVGPNLDQLKPAKDRVEHQVEVGGGPMPSFKGTLSPKQIQDVAAFVATSTHS
jgi:mono/diheme cytochrome c family protein